MSWAADFGTLHKISGMDQAAVIDQCPTNGVSDSPSLASYILPSFRGGVGAMHYDKSDDFKR